MAGPHAMREEAAGLQIAFWLASGHVHESHDLGLRIQAELVHVRFDERCLNDAFLQSSRISSAMPPKGKAHCLARMVAR